MSRWQRAMKRRLQLGHRLAVEQISRGDPVRCKSCQPAKTHPLIEQFRIAQTLDGNLFVVALQKHAFINLSAFEQSIDGLARTWSTVDVVAQKNKNWPDRGTERNIGIEAGKKLVEQIEATMNVAD